MLNLYAHKCEFEIFSMLSELVMEVCNGLVNNSTYSYEFS